MENSGANPLFKPGTCVIFEGFVNKPEFNGMLGQIKKHIKDDSYRVMLSSEKNDISVKSTFMKPVDHCPNDLRDNSVGMLVWPDIARSDYPGAQFFDYDDIAKVFANPFVGMPGDGMKNCEKRVAFYNKPENKMKMMMEFHETIYKILRKRLGWKLPTVNVVSTDRNCDMVFFDQLSQGKPNRWFETEFRKMLHPYRDINGAYVVFEGLQHPIDPQHWSLNHQKFNMGARAKGIMMEYQMGRKDMLNDCTKFSYENRCSVEFCVPCMAFVMEVERPRNKGDIRREQLEEKKRKKKQLADGERRQREIEAGAKKVMCKQGIEIKPFK